MKIVSENRFSRKTYFYTIAPSNHEKSCEVKMEKTKNTGNIRCTVCMEDFQGNRRQLSSRSLNHDTRFLPSSQLQISVSISLVPGKPILDFIKLNTVETGY